ncbi:type VI secretion system membrane subunit TssM [Archangium violaceum]|uniref:type VI secretion system membrane subunit TssM n=1 Tax=Archangium violaceum TaxID=83451 RepID=UPI002B2C6D04|nr:type VI secretion system membrane subunit TssM [Archangium gephyra]
MIWAIVITMLAGLAWGAITMLGMPPLLTGLATTGLLLLFALGRWIVGKVKARKAAKKLEGALEQQAEEQIKTVRPDLQPEIKAMQAEFSKAVEALKTSKLSRGRKDALAVLPWYLIVGPPGAGKSTALRNSGLKFPYLSAKGGGVRGVGGTRNCDWWLTNEAVILDTAGRYVSSEDDKPEWFAFLDTLTKYRPKRPINGLIVAVSVSELMGVDPQVAGELGQSIRERLDEITSRLRTLVPVYLMLTKCDLIPGFTEMYADLTRSERGQIWGFTSPMNAQAEASTDLLLERFDELVTVLEQRTLKRLGQERRLEARENIYQFPQKFDSLRKNLAEFVQPLFLDNVYQDTPVMRGLYFTSGTQEVKPMERLANSSGELFGDTRPQETSAEGRSYFLWDIFTKVMFQDQEMAVRSSIEEQRYRRRQLVLTATYFTAAALMLVLPIVSYFQNRTLARNVRDAITAVKLDDRDDIARIKDLSPLQTQLQELTKHRTEGTPFWLRFGMYQGERLFKPAQDFYNAALRRLLLGNQYERIGQNLQIFSDNQDSPQWKPGAEDYANHFDALKMYLLITRPHTPREPPLDEAHQDWLVDQMVRHWTHVRGTRGEVNLQQAISRHARTYIQMLSTDPEQLGFDRDTKIVRAARRALNRVPVTTLEMDRIVADVGREYPDQTLDDLVGAVPAMLATKRVRGAFTKTAWEQVVRSRLESAFKNKEAWVLDRDAKEDEEQSRAELRTRYYQQYIQEWKDFLLSITVQPPKNPDQMQALLESLTRGKPPAFGKLFRALAYNVQLVRTPKEEEKSTARRMIERVLPPDRQDEQKLLDPNAATGEYTIGPRDVEKEFTTLIRFNNEKSPSDDGEEQLTAQDFYQDQLLLVLTALMGVKEKPGESGALLEKIKTTRESVAMLVKKYESGVPILEKLLLPPVQDMSITVFATIAQAKSNDFCEAVAKPFNSIMANRYPFVRESMQDAPLAELSEFLRPSGGTLRKFLQQHLADDVITSGRKWTFANLNTRGMYRDDLLIFLDKANNLTTTLYPGDTVDPLVRFQVRVRAGTSPDTAPSEISSITLTIDGTDELYRNGPDNVWKPMSWPGQAGKLGAHIHVENASGATADIDEPGEWGLFRLLERVKRIEPSGDGRFFTAVWEVEDMNGALVAIDFRPERTANPFFGLSGNNTSRLLQIFRDPGLSPPMGITRGGKGCIDEMVSTNGAP